MLWPQVGDGLEISGLGVGESGSARQRTVGVNRITTRCDQDSGSERRTAAPSCDSLKRLPNQRERDVDHVVSPERIWTLPLPVRRRSQ